MNTVYFLAAYLLICTAGAIITQITGHSGRNIREALLVWWFLPLAVLYVFTSLIFEGRHEFIKSMREFKNELLNDSF